MTATPRTDAQADAFARLLRGSLIPTLVVAAGCVVVGFVSSPRAAWSAALGAGLVVGFFSLTLLAMKRTADMAPATVMMVMMATYTVKVIALGVAMFTLGRAPWVSGYAVGVTITVCALVWIAFELRAYTKLRILVFDPAQEAPSGTQDVDQ
ncbi:hypothetical protein V3N99_04210 [Dermatophilaceae bacterium Soc4.6]